MDAKICDACGKTILIKNYNRMSLTEKPSCKDSEPEYYHLCPDCFERFRSEARAYKISMEVDENGVVKES